MEPKEIIKRFRELFDGDKGLLEIIKSGLSYFIVDFRDIALHDPDLSEAFFFRPEESIRAAELAIKDMDLGKIDNDFRVRFVNLPKSQRIPIRKIRSKHLDNMISVEGVVRSRTNVRPMARTVEFGCPACEEKIIVIQLDNEQKEPTKCSCGRKGKFRILSRKFYDAMALALEEDVSELGEDTVPKRINVLLKYDLTSPENEELVVPGSSIRINGVLKELQIVTKNKKSNKFDIVLDANSMEIVDDSQKKLTFTKDDITKFRKFSKEKGCLDSLIASVVPQLHGFREIKLAVLLFIVKAMQKASKKNKVSIRDFFHVLIVGDPGTGKSEFGKDILNLSWKVKKAVGKGASGVGLTGSSEKDEFLGQRVLQSGMIPMCNGGHAVIDEVDKMDDEVQSHLLSAMEEGVININKSQVQGILKANVGIFMIANPKLGRFDNYGIIAEQINLAAPLISRFDFIFPVRDLPNKERDERIIDKILDKHSDIEKTTERHIPLDFLRKYLFYASSNIRPKLTPESAKVIKKFSMKLRNASGSAESKAIKITPRQIESVIRIAEAAAKLRLSDKVTEDDARLAIELLEYSLSSVGIDPKTGEIDIDRVVSNVSTSKRKEIVNVREIINKLTEKVGKMVPIDDIVREADSHAIDEGQVDDAIAKLKRSGDISEPKRGFIQKI